jgi:hypothetical protein
MADWVALRRELLLRDRDDDDCKCPCVNDDDDDIGRISRRRNRRRFLSELGRRRNLLALLVSSNINGNSSTKSLDNDTGDDGMELVSDSVSDINPLLDSVRRVILTATCDNDDDTPVPPVDFSLASLLLLLLVFMTIPS